MREYHLFRLKFSYKILEEISRHFTAELHDFQNSLQTFILSKLRLTHENHEIVNSSMVLLANTIPYIEQRDPYLLAFLHETALSTQAHWVHFYHVIGKLAPFLVKEAFKEKLYGFLT